MNKCIVCNCEIPVLDGLRFCSQECEDEFNQLMEEIADAIEWDVEDDINNDTQVS